MWDSHSQEYDVYFLFFFVAPNLRFQLSIYKIKIKFAYTSK
jgi:hypothetical protein